MVVMSGKSLGVEICSFEAASTTKHHRYHSRSKHFLDEGRRTPIGNHQQRPRWDFFPQKSKEVAYQVRYGRFKLNQFQLHVKGHVSHVFFIPPTWDQNPFSVHSPTQGVFRSAPGGGSLLAEEDFYIFGARCHEQTCGSDGQMKLIKAYGIPYLHTAHFESPKDLMHTDPQPRSSSEGSGQTDPQ